MTAIFRLVLSLSLLFLTTGIFASVVEPNGSQNQLQIIQPEALQFTLPQEFELPRKALDFALAVQPQADGSPSFQFEPVIILTLENLGVLYYSNARWYDPQLGRFISTDPIRSGDNWEIYALANPLRYVDPTGLADVGIYSDNNGAFSQKTKDDNWFKFGDGYIVPQTKKDTPNYYVENGIKPKDNTAYMFSSSGELLTTSTKSPSLVTLGITAAVTNAGMTGSYSFGLAYYRSAFGNYSQLFQDQSCSYIHLGRRRAVMGPLQIVVSKLSLLD